MLESIALFALTLVVVPFMMVVTIFAVLVTFVGVILAAKDSLVKYFGKSDKQVDKLTPTKPKVGVYEGEVCGRGYSPCLGTMETHPVINCSCHINPPCGGCTSPRDYCPTCEWEQADD